MMRSSRRWDRTPRCCRSMATGLIDLAALEEALAGGPALVAIQLVNNETGVIQPIDRIFELVRAQRVAAAGRLRPGRGQDRASGRRFHRHFGAQVRRSAGSGRAAGQRTSSHARAERRAGAGLSPRHREPAGGRGHGGGAGRPRLRFERCRGSNRLRQRLEQEIDRGGRRRHRRKERRASRRSALTPCPASPARASWCSSTSPAFRYRRGAPARRAA